MIKTDYEVRATKFAQFLAELFKDCVTRHEYEHAIRVYNSNHIRKLHYDYGISRIAIIRSDYVVKFNYGFNKDFGDCISEEKMYKKAVKDGMEHLLAKVTTMTLNGHVCAIMPRIKGVENYRKNWCNYCTDEEREWLYDHVRDLHKGNVGYRNGKVCVIDYAATW